jgi:hypothetical protein
MLRALVAALALANLVFWAWTAGALEGLGLGPAHERDPARLSQQVQPDAVRVLQPGAAIAALAAASAPRSSADSLSNDRSTWVCLEAGPFAGPAIDAAERALAAAALPDGAWVRTSQDVAAQYGVVLGPLTSTEALKKKREELGRLKVAVEALELPAEGAAPGTKLQPGLALGRYGSQGEAAAALSALRQRGVQTARVELLRPAGNEIWLRVESASPAQASQLRTLSGAALGAGFAPCAAASAPR